MALEGPYDVKEYSEYTVGDVMSTPLFKALPTMKVKEAASEMLKRKIGSVVVVNDNGSLIGIVTRTDIIRAVVVDGGDPEVLTLGDIMTRNPYYVLTDDPLARAAELMGTYGVGHLPVLDPDTLKPVGMISLRDIVRHAPEYIRLIEGLKMEIERRERLAGSSE